MHDSAPAAKSPRILIARLSAIGDVIQGLPVLNALRDRFPNAFLTWVVEQRAAALLVGHPALDELVTLPRGWLKSPGTVWRLRRRLRATAFDLAIDIQGLTKSAILTRLSGARRRIGFGGARGRELSKLFYTERVLASATHVVDQYLELLRPLGIDAPAVRFDIPEDEASRAAAERMIAQAGLEQGFCLMNTGAGWPSKLWRTDRFAAVARHLGGTWRLPTMVVWAGNEELAWAGEIAAASEGRAQVAPPTSLVELAALARRARLFIGSDTGPLHLAAAVGTPCVGLYGPWPAERHGPYGPRNVAVQKMVFEGATHDRRTAPRTYMDAILIEHVSEACDRILRREACSGQDGLTG
ncbi:MAG: glycosyltransferase family 9 protein [Pirellulales bacterium]